MEFFLGNASQQAIFRLMHSALHMATLTDDPAFLDLALWLLQSDNLHLIQWAGRSGSEAEVSAYFTPREWWDLGSDRILTEQQRVYTNFVRAMDAHV
jgi:alpha-amylase